MVRSIRIKITGIGKDDAYYPYRDRIVGQTGTLSDFELKYGWFNGFFQFDRPIQLKPLPDHVGMKYAFFGAVRGKRI